MQDGGFIHPTNPQPISFEGYATQAWVLQYFVQNIRQSGVTYIGAEENSGQRLVPAGGVLIGSQVNGKWDNNEGFIHLDSAEYPTVTGSPIGRVSIMQFFKDLLDIILWKVNRLN
ncbi:Uncharacterised protein [Citrobacter freundii]|nr:Uncharacterised protein [Citrobacter freundii]